MQQAANSTESNFEEVVIIPPEEAKLMKRKNFTQQEKIMMLRQIQADEPYAQHSKK